MKPNRIVKYVADDSEILAGAEERDIQRRKKFFIKGVESKIHPGNTVS